MPAPSNRIPVRPARGERAIFETSIDSIQEGEILYARDEDSLYIKENGVLVNVAQGTGIGDQIVSAEIEWILGVFNDDPSYGTGYVFDGPGLTVTDVNPTIYVIRGQKYKFNNPGAADPFEIATPAGNQYSIGITGTPAAEGVLRWEVSMQSPQKLIYRSTTDPAKTGNIIVLSDTFSLDLEDLNNVQVEPTATDGQSLIWNEGQQLWVPADLASGGVTNLAGLSDVDTTGAQTGEVLKYNGSYWENAPEATDPGSAGRKSTISVSDTRSGRMAGTEFILDNATDWTNLGFTIETDVNDALAVDEWNSVSTSLITSWAPLGRTDSTAGLSSIFYDGSGRVHTFLNSPVDFAPIASTKELSFPQNGAFGFTAFLNATGCVVHRAGYIPSYSYAGENWFILRIEYNRLGNLFPMEYWMSPGGSIAMKYGRNVDGFVFDTSNNKNGFVFSVGSGDSTLGQFNNDLVGLTTAGDYGIELWYSGTGYNLDDLANVTNSNIKPNQEGFPLVWKEGQWSTGSIVRDGAVASTSGGDIGLFALDSNYLYVATGLNSWKRIELETFV